MTLFSRSTVTLFLACTLGTLLSAQERPIKWSPWRAIDEQFPMVRIRTYLDNNEGRGWPDGRQHWRYEVKNASLRSTVKVGLAFSTWNLRSRMWDPPAEGLPPPFELEPGEVQEGATVGGDRDGFDYRYAVGLVGEDGKPRKVATGLNNSRIVNSPIKESSLIANAAHAKMAESENAIAAASDQPAAPAEALAPAKPAPAAKAAAPAAAAPTANLPMNAAPLAPVSTDGLDATAKFALWTQRAQQGDAESMFQLGRACRFGDGTARDHTAATEWYRQAAIRGHAGAMTKLAFAYDSGLGVERSDASALEWWRKAAATGEPEAVKKLAKLGLTP